MKHYLIIFFLSVNYITTLHAQTVSKQQASQYLQQADSLLWEEVDYEQIKILSEKVLQICSKIDCGELELDAKLNLAIVKEQNNNYDDYDNFVLPTIKNYDFKSPTLEAKFLCYFGSALGDGTGITYLLKSKKLYEENDVDNLFLAKTYGVLYFLYIQQSNYDSAEVHIDLLEIFANKTNNIRLKIDALKSKATILNNKGESAKALLNILEVDKLYKEHFPNSPDSWHFKLHDLIIGFFREKRYKEALETTLEVEEYYLSQNKENQQENHRNLFSTYIMKNNILRAQKKYHAALKAVEDAEKFFTPEPSQDAPYRAKQQYWADVYLIKVVKIRNLINLDRFEEAEKLTYEIIEIAHNPLMENFHKFMIIAVVNKFFSKSKNPPKPAAFTLLPYVDIMLQQNEKQYDQAILNAYMLRAYLQIHQKETTQATLSYLKVLEIKDTLSNRENNRLSKELLVQYETKEKEQQLALQNAELSKKTLQRNGFIIAALMLLGFGWYFWRQNQQLQKSKQTIEKQANELHQLYENKNRFFANIAHELRTPLTLIAGPIFKVLKNNHLPQAAQQSLSIANRNINYLQQLTNQILDLSKKEFGELSVQISNFQFSDILNALVQDFQPFANYQKIEFTPPNNIHNDIQLSTDGEKLFIVLKNLLSNAFKYTDSGRSVTFDYVDMNDQIQITVQDTGRGISKEDLKNIFNRYFQTNDPNAPIEGGTGIGLAVCKEYIESIGGTIQVNSEIGKGSTFVVQFPKKINGAISDNINLSFSQQILVEESISNAAVPIISDDMPTVLVVEDNLDICQYLQSILQHNYQLIFANNGEEALHQLGRHSKVDLILTDLMMPVMDGFELIENLKSQDNYRNIPIITLTARSEMADKLQALRIGVDDYLVKPFNEEELQIRIKHLLNNSTQRQAFLEEITEIAENGERATADNEPEMESSSSISKADAEWLNELEQIVKKRITDLDFNVNQLCLDAAISSSQLYRKLKGLTGLSPKNYINQIRYHQAKQLLENRRFSSVKKVAYEVGFKDEKNFSKNFKKRYGKNPSSYLE